jgi:heme-degrading monooxygenase HmoA
VTGRSEEDSLEWIPRSVRDALDVVAIKLHLREWQALPVADRAALAAAAGQQPLDRAAFTAQLTGLVVAHTGNVPDALDEVPGTRPASPQRRKGDRMAFVVTNRIPVAQGHEEDFEERFRKRAHLIDQSPGFIKNLILRPVQRRFDHASGAWVESKEQGYYLVQTYWESEQDFWNWTRSESFRIAHSNRPPAEMFAGANVLEIHEVIQTTERKEA